MRRRLIFPSLHVISRDHNWPIGAKPIPPAPSLPIPAKPLGGPGVLDTFV